MDLSSQPATLLCKSCFQAPDADDDTSSGMFGAVCARRYDDPRAHELELRDVPLMSAWRQAILGNTALFRGATVLDVGCGLGALSLLCAKVRGRKHHVLLLRRTRLVNRLTPLTSMTARRQPLPWPDHVEGCAQRWSAACDWDLVHVPHSCVAASRAPDPAYMK